MGRKNTAVLLLVIVLAGLSVYWSLNSRDQAVSLQTEVAPKLHYLAPAFQLTGLDGQAYRVGGKRDKPLVLNFWASWCGPCEEEAPDLVRMYDKYKDQLDLYAVNVTGNDDLSQVKAFVERHGYRFPVLLDEQLEAAMLYRFQVIPTSFLIDRNGFIVDIIHLVEPVELEGKLKRLVEG